MESLGERLAEASAAIAARWWALQPDGFVVLRDSRGLRGVLGLLDLTAVSDRVPTIPARRPRGITRDVTRPCGLASA